MVQSHNTDLARDRMVGSEYYDGKKIELPIKEDEMMQIFNHWIHQAVGGVLSAFATYKINRNENLNENHKYRFEKCAKKAEDVPDHARCVLNILEAKKTHEDRDEYIRAAPLSFISDQRKRHSGNWRSKLSASQSHSPVRSQNFGKPPYNKTIKRQQHVGGLRLHRFESDAPYRDNTSGDDNNPNDRMNAVDHRGLIDHQDRRPQHNGNDRSENEYDDQWVGEFLQARSKRWVNVVTRSNYSMLTKNLFRTPWGAAARILKKAVKVLKNKSEEKSWYAILAELKSLAQLKRKQDAAKKAMKRRIKESGDAQAKYEAIEELRRLSGPVDLQIKDFEGFPPEIEDHLREILTDDNHKLIDAPVKLIRQSIKLAMIIGGSNVTGFDNKTVRFASPKFLSVLPDETADNEVRLLSPSLFSMHQGGNSVEKVLSIPSLMRVINLLEAGDQEDLLDLIFEAAGVTDAFEVAKEKLIDAGETVNSARGINGQPLYFTAKNASDNYGEIEQRKVETFKALLNSFDDEQRESMNMTGFAPLTIEQLERLYGPHSPYYSSSALERLKQLEANESLLHEMLERDVRALAEAEQFEMREFEHPRHPHSRHKRFGIVLSPLLLTPLISMSGAVSQPIVLSPLVLSPVILSPAVLGPFILSPWLFIPVLLSPRVLSPFVLTPFVGSPLILSPVVLHPFILSPGILDPIILSPLVLSPIILTPLALTPFILSPLVLTPLIVNPMILSPLVLSPLFLSPLVLSPQYLFALILSPYILSPLVESNLTVAAVILSPSILSS